MIADEVQARVALRATAKTGAYKERFAALWRSLYDYAIQNPREFRQTQPQKLQVLGP